MVRLPEGIELADSRVASVAPRVSGIFADVALTLPEPPPRGLGQHSATWFWHQRPSSSIWSSSLSVALATMPSIFSVNLHPCSLRLLAASNGCGRLYVGSIKFGIFTEMSWSGGSIRTPGIFRSRYRRARSNHLACASSSWGRSFNSARPSRESRLRWLNVRFGLSREAHQTERSYCRSRISLKRRLLIGHWDGLWIP